MENRIEYSYYKNSDKCLAYAHTSGLSAVFLGIPIKSTLDNSATVQYAGLLHQLTMKARSTVRDIDPQNDLMFLRIRSKKHEIMVSTGESCLAYQPVKRLSSSHLPPVSPR